MTQPAVEAAAPAPETVEVQLVVLDSVRARAAGHEGVHLVRWRGRRVEGSSLCGLAGQWIRAPSDEQQVVCDACRAKALERVKDGTGIARPWEPDMSQTCRGCGQKAIVDGTCTLCGSKKAPGP